MKITQRFLYSPVCKDLESRVSANNRSLATFALIRLFLACESGVYFSTKKQLITRLEIGEKIGAILWDYCIEKEILRSTDYGYTAMPYMISHRYVTEKIEEDDVEFIYAKIELDDLQIASSAIPKIRRVYEQKDLLAIAGMYYLRNWMQTKEKKGLLVDNFDPYKALVTWVYKTVSGKDFDRIALFNRIHSIDQRESLDEFVTQSDNEQEELDDDIELIQLN